MSFAFQDVSPSDKSLRALERLALLPPDLSWKTLNRKKLAGILALLFLDAAGDLRVLLTTRAKNMRSFPGETALPGGRMDEGDLTIEDTAVRALRESTYRMRSALQTLTDARGKRGSRLGLNVRTFQNGVLDNYGIQPAIISRHFLFVIPAVYLLLCPLKQDLLRAEPAEVDAIFSAPLDWFASTDFHPQDATYTFKDLRWLDNKLYRLNSLAHSSFGSDVTGMTFDVLRLLSKAAYDHKEDVDTFSAPDQMSFPDLVLRVIRKHKEELQQQKQSKK